MGCSGTLLGFIIALRRPCVRYSAFVQTGWGWVGWGRLAVVSSTPLSVLSVVVRRCPPRHCEGNSCGSLVLVGVAALRLGSLRYGWVIVLGSVVRG